MMKSLKIGDLLARTPIVQGGMGVGISLSGLASAVANEGGVGVISSAGLGVIYRDYSPDYNIASIWGLREELRKAREKTRGIIGVNVMVAMSNFADMVKTAIQEKADIIFSGAGLPLNLPSFLTEGCRTKLAPIVSSARAAKLLCEKWLANYGYIPDAIVVEGPKAGGHLGYKADQIEDEHYSLEEILPPIVEEVHAFEAAHDCHIPVIAGGGVYTGEDIAHYARLGAAGAQLATRFIPTYECDASQTYKDVLLAANPEDVRIIHSPVGMPGRALNTPLVQKLAEGLRFPPKRCARCLKACDPAKVPYCITHALIEAVKGNVEEGLFFCGANVGQLDRMRSVRELMDELMDDWRKHQ